MPCARGLFAWAFGDGLGRRSLTLHGAILRRPLPPPLRMVSHLARLPRPSRRGARRGSGRGPRGGAQEGVSRGVSGGVPGGCPYRLTRKGVGKVPEKRALYFLVVIPCVNFAGTLFGHTFRALSQAPLPGTPLTFFGHTAYIFRAHPLHFSGTHFSGTPLTFCGHTPYIFRAHPPAFLGRASSIQRAHPRTNACARDHPRPGACFCARACARARA